jgi:3-hydroxyisobutyrate dehydrogenase-like beta-hydroxyacid dehydrogenase
VPATTPAEAPQTGPPPIGFIGLGHMGAAMARRLLAAGHGLVVHDRQPEACQRLAEDGATVAPDARAVAAAADVVILCLPSPAASLAVADELLRSPHRRLRILVETSTVCPHCLRELAERLGRQGVAVVDAPVSGGPSAAQAGTLALMHAGGAEATARVLPVLQAMAGRLFEVGTEPGLAQVCKLVNNAISAAGMIAACQATVVGVKAGLEAGTLLDAINAGSGRNAGTLDKFPRAILDGRFDYGGPLGLMLKDLALFIEQSQALGVPATLAQATCDEWTRAVQRSGPQADYSEVIRHLEIDAGVEVRRRAEPPMTTPPTGS